MSFEMESESRETFRELTERINQRARSGAPMDEIRDAMLNDCFEYVKAAKIFGDFTELGVEVLETADACLKYYSGEKGDFLSYFSTSMKKTVKQKKGKEAFFTNSMGTFSEADYESFLRTKREIRDLMDVYEDALVLNPDYTEEEIFRLIAISKSKTPETIEKAIRIQQARYQSLVRENEDGEEYSLADVLNPVGLNGQKDSKEPQPSLAWNYLFMDHIFHDLEKGKRSQQISACFTVSALKLLTREPDQSENIDELMRIRELEIFDEEIFQAFLHSRKIPELKKVAEEHGWFASDMSRTWKNFKEVVKTLAKKQLNGLIEDTSQEVG